MRRKTSPGCLGTIGSEVRIGHATLCAHRAVAAAQFWTAVASEARHRFSRRGRSKAVSRFACHRTPYNNRSCQRGLSLLEMLVAVGLLAVIIIGLVAMFNQTQKTLDRGVAQVDILENGRAVMLLLERELQGMSAPPPSGITN